MVGTDGSRVPSPRGGEAGCDSGDGREQSRREAAGERLQIIPDKLLFTLKAFTARCKVRGVGCGNYLPNEM